MSMSTGSKSEAPAGAPRGPKNLAAEFVVLCFLFSLPVWYFITRVPAGKSEMPLRVALMWCPGLAAIVARLWRQGNLKGFGLARGCPRWLMLAVFLPAIAGLLMFVPAWILQIAPLNRANLDRVFSLSFVPMFLIGLGFNCFAALGEELGWRGLLVPELSRWMSFTKLALVSGVIWMLWHVPLILWGSYHSALAFWEPLAFFAVIVIGSSFVQAWMRLASGSVWVAMLLHGSWNYFIQMFYPVLTTQTPRGERMLGEFGWLGPLICAVLALIFWCFRDRFPPSSENVPR
jgi:uncharacterized protein